MSNKQETALQMLIAELDEQAKTCPMSHRKFYKYCKTLAKLKLPKEEQQIKDAVQQSKYGPNQADQYFSDTYEQ